MTNFEDDTGITQLASQTNRTGHSAVLKLEYIAVHIFRNFPLGNTNSIIMIKNEFHNIITHRFL